MISNTLFVKSTQSGEIKMIYHSKLINDLAVSEKEEQEDELKWRCKRTFI